MTPVLAEILGPDLLILLVIVLVLFGGSRLPQLARSLGSAKREFEAGISEGPTEASAPSDPGPSAPH
jgi:sec-independent protein translocase protein TatA